MKCWLRREWMYRLLHFGLGKNVGSGDVYESKGFGGFGKVSHMSMCNLRLDDRTDFERIAHHSFVGLVLVTHSDSLLASVHASDISDTSAHIKNPMLGDVLALLSAFCYAVYVILLKVRIGDEERVDMQLFFG
jgi:hypothetical protein